MKKNLLFLFIFALFVVFPAFAVDSVKNLNPLDSNVVKKLENRAKSLERERVEKIKSDKSAKALQKQAKQERKNEIKNFKKQQKEELKAKKIEQKDAEKQAKIQAKELKKAQKEYLKQEKTQAKEAKRQAKDKKAAYEKIEEENTSAETSTLKTESEKKIAESSNDARNTNDEALSIHNLENVQENSVSIKDELINDNVPNQKQDETIEYKTPDDKILPEIPILEEKASLFAKDKNINIEEESIIAKTLDDDLENSGQEQIENIEKEEQTDIIQKDIVQETLLNEKTEQNPKKELTFQDIDKRAVSVNEFLQFSEKQNEKFSILYFETTSKLDEYAKKIKDKEKLIEETKKDGQNMQNLKKQNDELELLHKERDDYYNKSLAKFSSLLTKKQALKWEVLQQMGYRFFPEIE